MRGAVVDDCDDEGEGDYCPPPPSSNPDINIGRDRDADADAHHNHNDIPRKIASVALRHYRYLDVLPSSNGNGGGGRPQGGREWTVYAAVVAVLVSSPSPSSSDHDDPGDDDCWVVSCATGSKCRAVGVIGGGGGCGCGGDDEGAGLGGLVLHDSHAEVLARRGLMLRLWDEVESGLLRAPSESPSGGAVDEGGGRRRKKQLVGGTTSPDGHDECHGGGDGVAVGASAGDDRRGERANDEAGAGAAAGKDRDARRGRGRRLLVTRRRDDEGGGTSDDDGGDCVPTFELRPDVSLHLYVSDSPCGDASIYGLRRPEFAATAPGGGGGVGCGKIDSAADLVEAPPPHSNDVGFPSSSNDDNFTGAKLIVSERTGVTVEHLDVGQTLRCSSSRFPAPPPESSASSSSTTSSSSAAADTATAVVAREHRQLLGRLRTKAGRSNLPDRMRSTSMSCSDKLCRWNVWGWQGSLLSRYVPRPVTVASICVGLDPRGADITGTGTAAGDGGDAEAAGAAQLEALERAVPGRIGSVISALRDHFAAPSPPPVGSTNGTAAAASSSSSSSRACLRFVEGLVAAAAVPSVHVVPDVFPQGKSVTDALVAAAAAAAAAAAGGGCGCGTPADGGDCGGSPPPRCGDKRRRPVGADERIGAVRYSPCGMSINWRDPSGISPSSANGREESPGGRRRRRRRKRGRKQCDGGDEGVEVTVGATGLRRGKKPRTAEEFERSRSRLCRRGLLDRALRCGALLPSAAAATGRAPARGGTAAGDVDRDVDGTIPPWTSYRFVAVGSAGETGGGGVGGDADDSASRIASRKEEGWSYREIKEASAPPVHRETLDVALRLAGSPLAGWLRCADVDDFAVVVARGSGAT